MKDMSTPLMPGARENRCRPISMRPLMLTCVTATLPETRGSRACALIDGAICRMYAQLWLALDHQDMAENQWQQASAYHCLLCVYSPLCSCTYEVLQFSVYCGTIYCLHLHICQDTGVMVVISVQLQCLV